MSARRYLKPPWMQRHVGNRLAPLFRPSLLSKLSVRGRRTGRWHTVPVAVLEHAGERYLVSYRGESDWALNLRASHRARLSHRARVEEITVIEVPVPERAGLLEVYSARYGQAADGRCRPTRPSRSGRPSGLPDHCLQPPQSGNSHAGRMIKPAQLRHASYARAGVSNRTPLATRRIICDGLAALIERLAAHQPKIRLAA